MTSGSENGQLRSVDGAAQANGLVIYRASRLEVLLPPLRQLLAATPPAHALAPQTIIAAHPGMRQWLAGALAREYGSGGIAANLDIVLPSAWIGRLAQHELGAQAVALPGYQREHLRWTVHAALADGAAVSDLSDPRLLTYLQPAPDAAAGQDGDLARRRFELADRLAGVFSQYLVYRPDWLRAWEQGRYQVATRGSGDAGAAQTEQYLLGPLWRHLRNHVGAHRGDLVAELLLRLQQQAPVAGAPDVLHVFGVSHLAPSELAVLRAFARWRLVALYVPDPCREYWGGLARDLSGLRAQRRDEEARIGHAAGNDYWVDQGHPLLASWGRMGQHFIMALASDEGDVLEDVRHWQDTQPAAPTDRLGRVQQSIRQLQPALLAVDLHDQATLAAERGDASLRVHSCHTRLRELEVLRDQLLDALATPAADGSAIRPGDMVVMAPDIQAYVPLIPAVFGVPGDAHARPPYHLTDVAMAGSHGLFAAFRRWLALPTTRITAPEIVDLLAIPEVARRLDLDPDSVEELTAWLRQSRVAWALDGTFRSRFGAPPIAAHTFGWAMDRMLAGYLMADDVTGAEPAALTLPDGAELAPLTSVHGPATASLGALDQLLEEVQDWCDLATRTLPASTWARVLEQRFAALFRIDPGERDARDAQAQLLGFVHAVGSEPAAAGEDPLLHFAVVRDLLLARLSATAEHQRFLLGGITFCGMVPQRAIPYRLVAVLGLNDGEYPRAEHAAGVDLMTRFRRLGDRDVRSDDRYLFLETLMSARARLHLSFIGEGVRDGKPCNPAAPLAELLAVLDGAAGLAADDREAVRPWCVRHPLQPFDARYFDGADPRLFSYSAAFAAMHGRARLPAVPPFLDVTPETLAPPAQAPLPAAQAATAITLRELVDYYKDPARQLLHGQLQLRLDALDDDRLPAAEPLAAQFDPLDTVPRKLFFHDALAAGLWSLEQPPAWLRLGGIMPPGQPGEEAWRDAQAAVNALLEQARQLPGFAPVAPPASSCEIDLDVHGQRITGRVDDVFVTGIAGDAQWLLLRAFPGTDGKLKAEAELSFKDRVPMFLDWALVRLHTARALGQDAPAVCLRALVGDKSPPPWQAGINAWDAAFMATPATGRAPLLAGLEARVLQLATWMRQAEVSPRWYFPKAAWASLKGTLFSNSPAADAQGSAQAEPVVSIGSAWVSAFNAVGERDYSPGYSRLLAGAVDFAEGSPELAALHAFALELQRCISLPSPDSGDVA